MLRLDAADPSFRARLAVLTAWEDVADPRVMASVAEIVAAVARDGDQALLGYTARFDGFHPGQAAGLEIAPARLAAARGRIPAEQLEALEQAAERIRSYHRRQLAESWEYREVDGTRLGQRVTPLDRVGLYVPGGKAAYPSSVLMNAIPARVAGVGELLMVAPCPGGEVSDLVLAAASVAGVDRVFSVGGAQAVAALAYGTATIPRVDKIVGPGNVYVAAAKRLVFGTVGIDMIAGPSEIVVVSDGTADPDWLAMDLFSQAEHDENAQAILIAPDAQHLDAVAASLNRLLPGLERRDIASASLSRRGALIRVRDLAQAAEVVNVIAPEHLELAVADPDALLPAVRHAGAIFLGCHTPEAFGDYCAGPNHVLPTSGTARFSSPLGVYDFQKRSSLIGCTVAGGARLAPLAATLARGEGLTAHARSAEYRRGEG